MKIITFLPLCPYANKTECRKLGTTIYLYANRCKNSVFCPHYFLEFETLFRSWKFDLDMDSSPRAKPCEDTT